MCMFLGENGPNINKLNGLFFAQFFTFFIPSTYKPGAVYIVRETNILARQMLEQCVQERFRSGMYICYF